jgi:hypothetical protein
LKREGDLQGLSRNDRAKQGAPGRIRTSDPRIRSPLLFH